MSNGLSACVSKHMPQIPCTVCYRLSFYRCQGEWSPAECLSYCGPGTPLKQTLTPKSWPYTLTTPDVLLTKQSYPLLYSGQLQAERRGRGKVRWLTELHFVFTQYKKRACFIHASFHHVNDHYAYSIYSCTPGPLGRHNVLTEYLLCSQRCISKR